MKKLLIFISLLLLMSSCQSERKGERLLWVAHRGASGFLPEHTLEAKAYAHALGADYIEQDVVLSKDNKVIVLHDVTIEETTNVEEIFPKRQRKDGHYYVFDFTLEELRRLTIHPRERDSKPLFPKRFSKSMAPLKIHTLSEEIDFLLELNRVTDRKCGLFIEIKRSKEHLKEGKDILRTFADLMKEKKIEGKIPFYIQSFNPDDLKSLKKHFTWPLIQLVGEKEWRPEGSPVDDSLMLTQEGLTEVSQYADGVAPWVGSLIKKKRKRKDFLRIARKLDLKVFPYTLRKDHDISGMAFPELKTLLRKEWRVEGVFSDHPLLKTL